MRFGLGAVTVDPQYPGYDPSPLKAFCSRLGIPYFYESHALIDQVISLLECGEVKAIDHFRFMDLQASAHMDPAKASICAWCRYVPMIP